MANKKSKKEPFQWERFLAAKRRAKISITKLGSKDDGIGWSEKTIRRAKADGKISQEILEALAKRLDIDPDYLRGKYDHFYDLIADGFDEKQREIYLKKMLDPGRYPYYRGKNQIKLYEGYMDGILMLHGISNRQYDELSPEKRKAFQIDIEKAVGTVIEKYFECDGRGQSGIPDLYSLEAQIECYEPEQPEEPNDRTFFGYKDRFSEREYNDK
jgi:hypothetical protein